jgi:hypothetical protein
VQYEVVQLRARCAPPESLAQPGREIYRGFLDHLLISRHADCSIIYRVRNRERAERDFPAYGTHWARKREVADMKLNYTNRRRALQRRRKLMPEPRRISDHDQIDSRDTEVIREVPIGPTRPALSAEVSGIEQSDTETVVASN